MSAVDSFIRSFVVINIKSRNVYMHYVLVYVIDLLMFGLIFGIIHTMHLTLIINRCTVVTAVLHKVN